jgi:predicted HNH restriction endonuclease
MFLNNEIGWDGYLIGFRFMHYLEEEIGNGTYLKILNNAYSNQKDMQITLKEVNSAIKNVVSKSVFTNFASWYSDNKQLFKKEILLFDYTKCKKLNLFPSFAAYNFYQNLNFTYNKKLQLTSRTALNTCKPTSIIKLKALWGKLVVLVVQNSNFMI